MEIVVAFEVRNGEGRGKRFTQRGRTTAGRSDHIDSIFRHMLLFTCHRTTASTGPPQETLISNPASSAAPVHRMVRRFAYTAVIMLTDCSGSEQWSHQGTTSRPSRTLRAPGGLGRLATGSDIPYKATVRDRNRFRWGIATCQRAKRSLNSANCLSPLRT